MQIFSLYGDQTRRLSYWKTSTRVIWGNQWKLVHIFINMFKNECKKETAQHPSSTLKLTPKASRRARERSRWLFLSTWPQEVRREGHLPGYVSVTSKKEERRDTWSESDKSVRQHIYLYSRSEGAFTCLVLGWAWEHVLKRQRGVYRSQMMWEVASAVRSFKPLTP